MGIKKTKVYKFDYYSVYMSLPVKLALKFNFWKLVLENSRETIFTPKSIILYFLAISLVEITILPAMYVCYNLVNEINSGKIILWLLRPINYIKYELFKCLSEFSLRLIISSLILTIITVIFNLGIGNLILTFVSLFFSFIILFYIQFLIGAFAVMVKNTLSLRDNIMRIFFILGGSIVPIEIMPDFLQKIAEYTPIYYIYYAPSKIFSSSNSIDVSMKIIGFQVLCAFVLALILYLFWKFGLRGRIQNGG